MESTQYINNVKNSLITKKLDPNDFKELRRLCTVPKQQVKIIGCLIDCGLTISVQTYIAQELSWSLLGIHTLFHEQHTTSHDQQLDNFYLQFLANIVTQNRKNSVPTQQSFSSICFHLLQEIIYQHLVSKIQNQQAFSQLLESLVLNSPKHSKFAMIFFYNCTFQLKNTLPKQDYLFNPTIQRLLANILRAMVVFHQNEQIVHWSSLIIIQLFNYYTKNIDFSTTKYLSRLLRQNTHEQAQLFHIIGLLLEKVVNARSTPTLVAGIIPASQDIREMYIKVYDLTFMLSVSDVKYLINRYEEVSTEFRSALRKVFAQIATSTEQENNQHIERLNHLLELANQVNLVLSQITFLGGYNKRVQQLAFPVLLQLTKTLEVLYLMYKLSSGQQSRSTDYRIESPTINKFSQILSVQQGVKPQHIKLVYSKLYTIEQFALMLRLMSNLIHINPETQQFFEQNFEYLYIVMSLTNLDVDHPTMHEWSIIFIRNVCEVSVKLRGRIQALKVGLKSV